MELDRLEIVRLSPEHIPDYLDFFEHTAHTDYPEWDRCYCLNFSAVDNIREAETIFLDPDVRRAYAADYIHKGLLRGWLAYADGKVVGWCNANDRNRCLPSFGSRFIYGDAVPQKDEEKVLSIYCFTVAPALRGRGVATALLQRVLEDALKGGWDCVEAYPEKDTADVYNNFPGFPRLYEKLGFQRTGETAKRLVYRNLLRPL